MSQKTHPIIEDLLDELEQIEKIITKRRALSNENKAIMIRKRMSAISFHFNKLSFIDLPIEDLVAGFQKLLNKTSAILGLKDDDDESLYWYHLQSFRFNLIGQLMSVWGKGGHLRVIGTANAFGNMLLGIDIIDVDPVLVPKDHPEFLSRSALAVNLVNFNAGMFYIATNSLYSIPKHLLDEWAINALKGNQQLLKVFDNVWDIRCYLEYDRKLGEGRTVNRCAATLAIFVSMIQSLMLLYTRMENEWPDLTEEKITFVDVHSTDAFLESIDSLFAKEQQYIDDITTHVEEGIFDRNNNPFDDPSIQRVLFLNNIMKLTYQGIKVVHQGIIKQQPEKLDELVPVIDSFKQILVNQQQLIQDPEFLDNPFAETIIGILEEYIYFSAIYAKYKNDITILERVIDLMGIYVSKDGIERFPLLYGLYLTARLQLAIEENDYTKVEKVADELLETSKFFMFFPRDMFAHTILGYLTKVLLGKMDKEDFFVEITEIIEEMEEYTEQSTLNDINKYITNLKLALVGEEPNYDPERLTWKTAFDPTTLLIPDLNKLVTNEEYSSIVYLPFNTAKDYVVYQKKDD